MTDRLILNRNDGVDTIHRAAGLTESCNTDQIKDREVVDTMTAAAMLDSGEAVRCQHCNAEETP